MTAATPFHPRPAALRGGAVLWIAVLVFLFQLLGAAHHHHEVASKSQHCVACALHAQPHAAPPDPLLSAIPVTWTLLHALQAVLPVDHPVPQVPYLLPLPHAPPSFPLPH